jgi:hypothetical protein
LRHQRLSLRRIELRVARNLQAVHCSALTCVGPQLPHHGIRIANQSGSDLNRLYGVIAAYFSAAITPYCLFS